MCSLSRDQVMSRLFPAPAWYNLVAVTSLLMVSVVLLPAAEFVMRDLQANASARPTAFDFSLTTPTFTRSGSDSFDAGTAIELGGRYSLGRVGDPFGLVFGLDATTEAYSYDSEDFMFAYGLRGSAGIGYAFTDNWTVTTEAGLSYGKSSMSLPATSVSPAFSADGNYNTFDARIVGLYTISKRMLISLQLGYLFASHDLDTNVGDKLTLDINGPYIGIGMTWRFSNAPERVE